MSFRYTCQQCGASLKIKEEKIGTTSRCPACKKEFVVPSPEEAAAEPETESHPDSSQEIAISAPPSDAELTSQPKPQPAKAKTSGGVSEDDIESFLMDDSGPAKARKPITPFATALGGGADLEAPRPRPSSAGTANAGDLEAGSGPVAPSTAAARAFTEMMTPKEKRKKGKAFGESETEGQEAEYSVFETIRGNLPVFGGLGGGTIVVCILCYYFVNSMFPSSKLPPLHYVAGKVTVNGEPLKNALVTFTPMREKSSKDVSVAASMARTDENGKYILIYREGYPGAVSGSHYVNVEYSEQTGVPWEFPEIKRGLIIEVGPGASPDQYDIGLSHVKKSTPASP
jgi:uncharacterized Zn finger protein (UPF0148 family)